MFRRIGIGITALALAACATRHVPANAGGPMRVRLTSWPESAKVSLDCGEHPIAATAPVDFDFPDGPDARCSADLTAAHYLPLHADIDRRYLFSNGDFVKGSQPAMTGPRVMPPYGHVTGVDALVLSIAIGLEHLVSAAHHAAIRDQPDVIVHVSLQPQP